MTRSPQITDTGIVDLCVFANKRTYLSRDSALDECFDGMTPYVCKHFPHWHVGHPYGSRA